MKCKKNEKSVSMILRFEPRKTRMVEDVSRKKGAISWYIQRLCWSYTFFPLLTTEPRIYLNYFVVVSIR